MRPHCKVVFLNFSQQNKMLFPFLVRAGSWTTIGPRTKWWNDVWWWDVCDIWGLQAGENSDCAPHAYRKSHSWNYLKRPSGGAQQQITFYKNGLSSDWRLHGRSCSLNSWQSYSSSWNYLSWSNVETNYRIPNKNNIIEYPSSGLSESDLHFDFQI